VREKKARPPRASARACRARCRYPSSLTLPAHRPLQSPCVKIHSRDSSGNLTAPGRRFLPLCIPYYCCYAAPPAVARRRCTAAPSGVERVLLKQVISMNYCNALVLPAPSVHFRGPRLRVRAYTYTSRWRSASRGCCEPRCGALSLSLWILRGSTCQALTRPDYTAEVSPAKDSTSGNGRTGSAREREREREREGGREGAAPSRTLAYVPRATASLLLRFDSLSRVIIDRGRRGRRARE